MDLHKYAPFLNQNILNWNSNGLKKNLRLLQDFVTRQNVAVAVITETHLTEKDKIKIPNFSIYRFDRTARKAYGGVMIAVRRNLSHSQITFNGLQRLEAVGIRLDLKSNTSINIVGGYHRPNYTIVEADFEEIFSGLPTILIGDLNSKHQIWGCRSSNNNGKRLQQFIDRRGILALAPNEPTFYPSTHRIY